MHLVPFAAKFVIPARAVQPHSDKPLHETVEILVIAVLRSSPRPDLAQTEKSPECMYSNSLLPEAQGRNSDQCTAPALLTIHSGLHNCFTSTRSLIRPHSLRTLDFIRAPFCGIVKAQQFRDADFLSLTVDRMSAVHRRNGERQLHDTLVQVDQADRWLTVMLHGVA